MILQGVVRWTLVCGVISFGYVPAAVGDPTEGSPVLSRIAETGVIRLGYGDSAPFSFERSDGAIAGYSIELCHRIVDQIRDAYDMGELHVEYVERSAANRIALLDDNEMDIECNASTVTEERQRFAAFSPPHFYTDTPYVARAEQKLCTLDALRGRSMVVVRGTVNVAMATAVSRERNLNLAFVIAVTARFEPPP